MSPFDTQVGGSHYVGMKIQPIVFAMTMQWDAGAFSVLKYTGRHNKPTGKGKQDVEKAIHFIDLRAPFYKFVRRPDTPLLDRITIADYCRENEITGYEQQALHFLEQMVDYPGDKVSEQGLRDCLNRILASYD